jgi:hypothetical protein
MERKIFYTEKQKFKKGWLWLILLGINAFPLITIFKQEMSGQEAGADGLNGNALIFCIGLSILCVLLFLGTQLETLLKEDGIYVRFSPFHLKPKHYPWSSLTKCYVREYSPITEFGGWGWRIGLFGRGIAYNVSGNKGLQLEFSNGKKLLIGTARPDQITEVLEQMGELKR